MDLEASEPAFEHTRQSERVFFSNISKERASLEEKEPSMAKESEKQSELCVDDSDLDSDSDLEASEPAFAHLQRSERVFCSNTMKEHAVLEEEGHKEVEKSQNRPKQTSNQQSQRQSLQRRHQTAATTTRLCITKKENNNRGSVKGSGTTADSNNEK